MATDTATGTAAHRNSRRYDARRNHRGNKHTEREHVSRHKRGLSKVVSDARLVGPEVKKNGNKKKKKKKRQTKKKKRRRRRRENDEEREESEEEDKESHTEVAEEPADKATKKKL